MSIEKLKSLGMVQNPFMFKVNLAIPESVSNLTFLVRSTKIPYSFEREGRVIRVAGNEEFVIPTQFILTSHEWEVTFLFMEADDTNFKALNAWAFLTDNVPMEAVKALATIELLNLNEEITYTFYIQGIFPKKIEFNEDLSYDEASGMFTYTTILSFDNIYFERDGITIRSLT